MLKPGMCGWVQLLLFPAGVLCGAAVWLSYRCFRWSGLLLYFGFIPLMIWAENSNFIDLYKCYAARQVLLFTGYMLIFWGIDFLLRCGKMSRWKAVCCSVLPLILYAPAAAILFRNKIDDSHVSFESVKAVYQTDLAEAVDFIIGQSHGIWCLPLVIVFLAGVWYWNFRSVKREFQYGKAAWAAAASVLAGGVITVFSFERVDFSSLTSELISRSLEYFDEVDRYSAGRELRLQQAEELKKGEGNKGIFVLIIGESHNKRYFSSYGYKLPTTPNMEKFRRQDDFIFFENTYSNHCQTVPSLSYMLTNRNQYEPETTAVTLLDMVRVMGGKSLWLSNQFPWGEFDTPIAAIAHGADKVHFLNTGSDFLLKRTDYDTSLIKFLPEMMDFGNGLVILHMMGSHRHYPNRYPAGYLENGSFSEYEKSIHYSDKALGEMLEFFRKDERVKAVVFVSDHSHIPADKRGHNADQYTQEMTEIPMFVYLSPAYRKENRELTANLRLNRKAVFTNDLVFELMLSLFGIAPSSDWNIGQSGYALNCTNARTLWGTQRINSQTDGIE